MTRGIMHDVERYFRDLSAQSLPFRYWADPNRKEGALDMLLQVRVCPIQLWDISFPEAYKDTMLSTLFPNGAQGMGMNRKIMALGLRTLMGFDPIPSDWKKENKIFVPSSNLNIEMIGIGIKEDVKLPVETPKIEQI